MRKGFTLVELLVVVAILGILAAVGIVSFGGFLGSAKENTSKSNHVNVVSFIETYWLKCSLNPSAKIDDLLNSNGDKRGSGNHNCATENSWGHIFHDHFEGSDLKNPYNSEELQVYM